MGKLKSSPLIELIGQSFGLNANAYDVTCIAAKKGSQDAAEMIAGLHKAMEETGVLDTEEVRRQVGDFVLRLSFAVAEQDGPITVDLEGYEELNSYIDTYQCFVNRVG